MIIKTSRIQCSKKGNEKKIELKPKETQLKSIELEHVILRLKNKTKERLKWT